MSDWEVIFAPEFSPEYDALGEEVQDELLAHLNVLAKEGPQLGRPYVDTLKGSKYANMKELRFAFEGGAWRFAFAFDPKRRAVVLVGGDKDGKDQSRFYKNLIKTAETRYGAHIERLKK
jgi:hypothetical protein